MIYHLFKTKILFIVCLIGLLYQTHLLLDEYFSGKTVVHIEIGKQHDVYLPAFTICIPYYLSMERTAQNRPELSAKYFKYQDILKTFNAGNENETFPNSLTRNSMKEIYNDFLHHVDELNMPAHVLLNNFSIPFDG